MASTATRSEGGNALRATRARGILQAVEAVRQIALTPTADRMALTGHLGSHVQIGWAVWRGDPEDQPTTKGPGLGGGMGAHKGFQTGVFLRSEGDWACHRHRHGQYPSSRRDSATCGEPAHDFIPCRSQSLLAQDLRNGHLACFFINLRFQVDYEIIKHFVIIFYPLLNILIGFFFPLLNLL